ncbi:hypothetical protein, partial [Limnohabitans sp.]|uniref:hypothetical protein n=1 Tax=Limnohabitans sp. TaxID=1907725 RepID=UPI0037C164AB
LVRTAITNDGTSDNNETFKLAATNTGGTVSTGGVATIKDDGTDTIFKNDGTDDTTVVRDDDRALSVNSITVNEASPYGVFEVTGAANQLTSLALALGTSNPATAGGTDYSLASGSGLSYSTDSGANWTSYTGGNVALDASGKLLVRTAITNDGTSDNNETFKLAATNTGGTVSTGGVATIKDDGTGTIFKNDGTDDTTVVRDDDRPFTVTGGNYNENSPRAVFTVNANPGQLLTLDVQNDAEPGKAPTGDNEGKPNDSLDIAPIYYSLDGGATWQLYTGPVRAGAVPVLVAIDITNERDNFYEGEEQLKLVVASGGHSASGFSSIFDDGTGTVTSPITALTTNDTGANDPSVSKDDDRPKSAPDKSTKEALTTKSTATTDSSTEQSAPATRAFSSEVQPLAPRLVPVEAPVPIGDVLTSSSGFRVAVNETASPGLALNRGVTDQFVEGNGSSSKVSLPFDAFIHSNKDAVIKLDAKLADNSPLPAWVRFDPATGSFEVNPPKDFKGKLDLKVIAMDDDSREAVALFQLFVGDKPAEQKPQSRNSLTEKLRLAGQQRPITLIKLGGEVTKPAPTREVSVRAVEAPKATAG